MPESTPEIDWVSPASTHIKLLGYHHARSVLIVQFVKDSSVWEFDSVAPETFEAMKNSESVGHYFFAHVKGKFAAERVPHDRYQLD